MQDAAAATASSPAPTREQALEVMIDNIADDQQQQAPSTPNGVPLGQALGRTPTIQDYQRQWKHNAAKLPEPLNADSDEELAKEMEALGLTEQDVAAQQRAEAERKKRARTRLIDVVDPQRVPDATADASRMQLLVNDQGDLSLTRMPVTEDEFAQLFHMLCNDALSRYKIDPLWRAVTPQVRHESTTWASLNEFYSYICDTHNRLMTKSVSILRALPIVTTTARRGRAPVQPRACMALGCGTEHAVLLGTIHESSSKPSEELAASGDFAMFAARLTDSSVLTVEQLQRDCGLSSVRLADCDDGFLQRAQRECTPRYMHVPGFKLPRARVVCTNVFGYSATVAYVPQQSDGSADVTHADLRIRVATQRLDKPMEKCVHVLLGDITAADKWLMACNGQFLAMAFSGSDTVPRHIRLYLINKPTLGFVQFAITSRAPNATHGELAAITALSFNAASSDTTPELLLALDDLTVARVGLLMPTAQHTVPKSYAAELLDRIESSMRRCSVVPTPEQELRMNELNPVVPGRQAREDCSARQHTEYVAGAVGIDGRLLVASAQNFLIKTLMAMDDAPSIEQHLNTMADMPVGTLPFLFQHGAGRCVSMATAGNALLVHFFHDNAVVLIDLRTGQPINVLKGSQLLGFNAEQAAKSAGVELGKIADPHASQVRYQSTWCALGRCIMQAVGGELLIIEPLRQQQQPQPQPQPAKK